MHAAMTEICANCQGMIVKALRYGCRLCFEQTKNSKTFCSQQCVNEHKVKIHGVSPSGRDS